MQTKTRRARRTSQSLGAAHCRIIGIADRLGAFRYCTCKAWPVTLALRPAPASVPAATMSVASRVLFVRTWTCDGCPAVHDRDVAAARVAGTGFGHEAKARLCRSWRSSGIRPVSSRRDMFECCRYDAGRSGMNESNERKSSHERNQSLPSLICGYGRAARLTQILHRSRS